MCAAPSLSSSVSCCMGLLAKHSAYLAYVFSVAHCNWPYHRNGKSLFHYVEWSHSAASVVRLSPYRTYAASCVRWGPHFIVGGGLVQNRKLPHNKINFLFYISTWVFFFFVGHPIHSRKVICFLPVFTNSCWTCILHCSCSSCIEKWNIYFIPHNSIQEYRILNVVSSISTLFSTSSRPPSGATQPPIQWVPGALSLGVKRLGREADHSLPASAEVKKMWIYTSTPPYSFMA
jgi:hypothetical protein